MSTNPVTQWEIRHDREADWQSISVPGCWEDAGFPLNDPGPYWYRCKLPITDVAPGRRLWLRFGAVSYDCTVWVNGQKGGNHTGMWDPFEVEITSAVRPGQRAEVLVRVEKPASLTAGPDSPAVPGRFPLRQTLSGFLPYVWGHAFGGLWQEVALAITGPCRLDRVHVRGGARGQVRIGGKCSGRGPLALSICDPEGRLLLEETLDAGPEFEWSGRLPGAQPWSPLHPALYTARLLLLDGDERQVRFGLRSLEAKGASLRLNGQPIYPRLALSWGWYPGSRCPNPGPERVHQDLLRLKGMGYNGVKLCLWVPPAYYLDLADELGMLVWLELPMWLPEPGPTFYQQAPSEYARLVQQASQHPCVLFYSLGCELNRSVSSEFLASLYRQTKALAGDALVCDNSGSGEAYGGWTEGSADFYDHHFYCDLEYLQPLLAAFAPGWRGEKPWLMGEFCDYDTLRDLPALAREGGDAPAWWMQADPQANPQGARWEMRVTGHQEALARSGLAGRLEELVQASYRQSLLHRKVTLEAVRARPEMSGYVVTGEADTPVSTAGMWDDLGRVKFDPNSFRAFNDDRVLLVGWDRKRAWVAGGDRPAFWDPYNYAAGTPVRAHLLAANHSPFRGKAHLAWELAFPGQAALAAGELPVRLGRGCVQKVGLAEFRAPEVDRPARLTLRVQLQAGGETHTNEWPLWVYPADPWIDVGPFGLSDPPGILSDLATVAGGRLQPTSPMADGRVLICTVWTPEIDAWVRWGGRTILLQQKWGAPGPLPTVECPYWREALKWTEPHPAWGDLCQEPDPGLQFYSLATDCALDATVLAASASPLLRRLDTRSLEVHEYALVLDWGQGKLIVTTLRLQGGLGDQPSGPSTSPAAAHLLGCWLRYLSGAGQRPMAPAD